MMYYQIMYIHLYIDIRREILCISRIFVHIHTSNDQRIKFYYKSDTDDVIFLSIYRTEITRTSHIRIFQVAKVVFFLLLLLSGSRDARNLLSFVALYVCTYGNIYIYIYIICTLCIYNLKIFYNYNISLSRAGKDHVFIHDS